MKLVAWGKTDVGRMRDHNEDSIVVDGPLQLYVVADGVGGRQAGEVASSMVAAHIHRRYKDFFKSEAEALAVDERSGLVDRLVGLLPYWVNEASEAIYTRAQKTPEMKHMKTTALVLAVMGARGVFSHVGDSRLYLVRDGQIFQLTKDQTLLQMYLDLGVLTPEQGSTFRHRNVLSQSVGGKPSVQPATTTVDVYPGDRFVLCSDGLSDLVGSSEIRDVVLRLEPKASTAELVNLANARGGRDNITAVCVSAQGSQPAHRPSMRSEQKIELLAGIRIFEDLSFQERLRVISLAQDVRFPDGHVIFREGDLGYDFYVVLSGNVSVLKSNNIINSISVGGHFGEAALVTDGRRSATIASAGVSHHLRISRDGLLGLIRNDPVLGVKLLWRFLESFGWRLRGVSDELVKRL